MHEEKALGACARPWPPNPLARVAGWPPFPSLAQLRLCLEAYGTILAMYLTDASRSMKHVNGWLHEPYYLTTCVPDGELLCQQQMVA